MDHVSARIDENGVKTKKVIAKTRFQGLVCDRFKIPGASSKETRV